LDLIPFLDLDEYTTGGGPGISGKLLEIGLDMGEKRAELVREISESRRFVGKTLTKRRCRRLLGRAGGYGWDRVEEAHLQGVPGQVGPAAETAVVR
jgi:hypothetical protein